MNKIELLAPAKDKQTAAAAINSGADAIYIGASNFGARKNAANSLEEIHEIINYAHKFNVKVYITLNTILTDSELEEAKKLVNKLYDIGADAIIVQDMGLVEAAVRKEIPPIALHASTQCDNRSLEKVKFFENLGISRVILARELSLNTIKEICENTNIEIETFIHGALCVSYSGQCYLSCSNGGRSANRGECAQPCRKKYSLIDEKGRFIAQNKYLLSLKDFNASTHIENLINAGVKSFKIEGRLKDANYVKNVVLFYRKLIDKYAEKTSSGTVFADFTPDLNKSFNRGFTDYFLQTRGKCYNLDTQKSIGEKIGKVKNASSDFFEIELFTAQNNHISPQDGLCYFADNELQGFLVNKVTNGKVYPNKKVYLKPGTVIFRNYNAEFEKLLDNSKTTRKIIASFEFNENILKLEDEDNNSISIEVQSSEKANNPDKMRETFIKQLKKSGDSEFFITNVQIKQDVPFMPVSEINELRRTAFDRLMQVRLNNYKREIQKPLSHAEYPIKNLDYRANIYNKTAEEFYEHCGCKVCETAFEALTEVKDKELMRTKHCLKYAYNLCRTQGKLFLADEKGKRYRLEFDCKNCEMIIKSD